MAEDASLDKKKKEGMTRRQALFAIGGGVAGVAGLSQVARTRSENQAFRQIEEEAAGDIGKFSTVTFKPVDPAEASNVLALALRLKAEGYGGINFGEGGHISLKQYDIFSALVSNPDLGVNMYFLEEESKRDKTAKQAAVEKDVAKRVDEYQKLSPELISKRKKFADVLKARGAGLKPDSPIRVVFTDTHDSAHLAAAVAAPSLTDLAFPLDIKQKYHMDKATALRNAHMSEVMVSKIDEALHNPNIKQPFYIAHHGMSHFDSAGDVNEIVAARLSEMGHLFKAANVYVVPVGAKQRQLDGQIFRKPGSSEYMITICEPELPVSFNVDRNGRLSQEGEHFPHVLDLEALAKKQYIPAIESPHMKHAAKRDAELKR